MNWTKTIIAAMLIVIFILLAYVIGYFNGINAFINSRYEKEYIQMTGLIKEMNNATLKVGQNSQRYATVKGIVSENELIQLKQLLQGEFGNTYPFVYRLEVDVKR